LQGELVQNQLATIPAKVVGSLFPMTVILIVVRSVLESATSLRAACGACHISAQTFGFAGESELSHTTAQNMILRIGLHELTRPKEISNDWIWLIDHTINGGTTKCLIVLGIRQSDYLTLKRPLEHKDLQALALLPVEQSNGPIVRDQLADLTNNVGVPMAVLSDRGSDLKKGVELLRGSHPEIIALYDIVHVVSRMIEKILKSDERWAAYRQACCVCANATRQSKLAHLKPPKPKTKARYMNIAQEVRWGARSLAMVDAARRGEWSPKQQESLSLDSLEKRLGWLDEYRDSLSQWEAISHVHQTTCRVVRQCGYGEALVSRLQSALGNPANELVSELVTKVIAHCQQSSELVGLHGRLPGSTEVLESLIGKGKRLAGAQASGSMTRQVLAMVASVVTPTAELIREAFTRCGIKHVADWCQTNLPVSTQADRRRDLVPTQAEQKLRKDAIATTPSF
jgi:hypothetical protein